MEKTLADLREDLRRWDEAMDAWTFCIGRIDEKSVDKLHKEVRHYGEKFLRTFREVAKSMDRGNRLCG